jgi:hypothetical protein
MSIEFIELYKTIMDKTLLTPDRLWYLWTLPRTQVEEGIEGDFAELGVFNGGSAYIIYNSVHMARPLHLFDTFEGIPAEQLTDYDYHTKNVVHEEAGAKGNMKSGVFVGDLPAVTSLFRGASNVNIYKGMFPTTAKALASNIKFSFVHVDMDIYEPTRAALEFFYKRMNDGGVFVVDDYGHLNGVTKAVNEFAAENQLKVIQSAFMKCVLRKPISKQVVPEWNPKHVLWQFGV